MLQQSDQIGVVTQLVGKAFGKVQKVIIPKFFIFQELNELRYR